MKIYYTKIIFENFRKIICKKFAKFVNFLKIKHQVCKILLLSKKYYININ